MIGAMPADRPALWSGPQGLPRRALLRRTGYAVGAVLLAGGGSGCGVELEPDAPDLPLLPRRTPAAGSSAILALWAGTLGLRDAAVAAGGATTALPARLAALHSEQGQVLQGLLDRADVSRRDQTAARAARAAATSTPTTTPTPTQPSPTTPPTRPPATTPPGTTPTPTTTAGGRARALGGLEAAAASEHELEVVTSVPAAVFATGASLLAQRGAAATLLGIAPEWPEPSWDNAEDGLPLLAAVRSAVYGFEVVTAQAGARRRDLADASLDALRVRARSLTDTFGDTAPPPPPGYSLPFAVTTAGDSTRLALHLLRRLAAAEAAVLPMLQSRPGGLPGALAALAEAEVLSARWGLPLTPFPGLA